MKQNNKCDILNGVMKMINQQKQKQNNDNDNIKYANLT